MIAFFLSVLCGLAMAEPALPDPREYDSDTKLMINVCNKFAGEPSAEKLHKVAMAMQLNRTINCIEFMGECKAYTSCLSTMIRVSKDGRITSSERVEMRKAVDELKSAVDKGRAKLRQQR